MEKTYESLDARHARHEVAAKRADGMRGEIADLGGEVERVKRENAVMVAALRDTKQDISLFCFWYCLIQSPL